MRCEADQAAPAVGITSRCIRLIASMWLAMSSSAIRERSFPSAIQRSRSLCGIAFGGIDRRFCGTVYSAALSRGSTAGIGEHPPNEKGRRAFPSGTRC